MGEAYWKDQAFKLAHALDDTVALYGLHKDDDYATMDRVYYLLDRMHDKHQMPITAGVAQRIEQKRAKS